ncbi:AAA family ATPase [Marinobacterium lutimaris]|nr:AAA family ATPase [Marinobacterium lutimaris]
MRKQLWVLVGGNGAGKSTFYHRFLEPKGMKFVNADVLAKQFYPEAPEAHSYEAAEQAGILRERMLAEGRNFAFETVFSHPSKIDFIAKAKSYGYEIIMVVLHVNDVSLNKARISQRVEEGGHFVPDEKVETRIPRTLANIKAAIPLCDRVHILDNSSFDSPFRQVLTISNQNVDYACSPLPDWAQNLIRISSV